MAVPVGMPDHALLTRARDGDGEAFEALYRRHHRAATRAAHSYSSRSQLAEDAVQEAFMRILHATKEGGGPITEFRAYLATTVRHVIAGWTRGERTIATDELEALAGEDVRDTSRPESRLRWHLLTKAFKSLPTRWQEALWLGEVEGVSPAELAERWNMSANSAAALSYRAREGLRTAWLDAHVNDGLVPDDCRPYVSDLSRYTQGKLTDRRETQVRGHLDDCEYCRAVLFEVDAAASELRVLLLPAALWGGLTLAGAGLSLGPVTWVAKRFAAMGRRGLAFGAASTAAVVVVAVVAINPGSAEPLGGADDGRRLVTSPVAGGSSGGGTDASSDDDADGATEPTDEPSDEPSIPTTSPDDDAEQTGSTVTPGGPGTTTRNPSADPPSKTPAPGGSVPTTPPVTTPTDPAPTVPPVTEEPEEVPVPVLAPDVVTTDGLIELHGTGVAGATVSVVIADGDATAATNGAAGATRSVLPRGPVALAGAAIATATVDTVGNWRVPATDLDIDAVAGLTVMATQTIEGRTSPTSATVTLLAAAPTIGPEPPVEGAEHRVEITGTGTAGAFVDVLGADGNVLTQSEVDPEGIWWASVLLTPELADTEVVATQVLSSGLRSFVSPPAVLPSYVPNDPVMDPVAVARDQIRFSGTGEPHASVEVVVGGTVLVADTVDEWGSWAMAVPIDTSLGGTEAFASQTFTDQISQSESVTIPRIPDAPTIDLGLGIGDIVVALVGDAEPGAIVELRDPSDPEASAVATATVLDALWLVALADIPSGVEQVYAVQIVDGVESPPSEPFDVSLLIGIGLELE